MGVFVYGVGCQQSAPAVWRRKAWCSPPVQSKVCHGRWAWLPESYQSLRNVCGFSKPHLQAEEWGTSQDLSRLWVQTLGKAFTRQVWDEARFGVGLAKETVQ